MDSLSIIAQPVLIGEQSTDVKVDKRMNNRGAAMRMSYSASYKLTFVEDVNYNLDSGMFQTPTSYFRSKELTEDKVVNCVKNYGSWSKNIEKITAATMKNFKKSTVGKSPFHKVEAKLYQVITDHRAKGRRVSNNFIRLEALKIFNIMKLDNSSGLAGKVFKASNGWRSNFMKRKKLGIEKGNRGIRNHPTNMLRHTLSFSKNLDLTS